MTMCFVDFCSTQRVEEMALYVVAALPFACLSGVFLTLVLGGVALQHFELNVSETTK
jgi:hypothetical protein